MRRRRNHMHPSGQASSGNFGEEEGGWGKKQLSFPHLFLFFLLLPAPPTTDPPHTARLLSVCDGAAASAGGRGERKGREGKGREEGERREGEKKGEKRAHMLPCCCCRCCLWWWWFSLSLLSSSSS